MSDDFHPDMLDDELRRRFTAGAQGETDPDVVLGAMRPRLQRARTRRRTWMVSAVGGVAAAVVVLLVLLGGGGGGNGSVRTPPASEGSVRTVPTTSPTADATTRDTRPDAQGTDAASSVPDPTAPDPSTPEPATPPTPATSIVQESYSSDGGSITVDLVDGRVSLSGSIPATGYTPVVHENGPTRVEVRFSNGRTEWRIRVDLVDDRLQPEITRHG